MSDNQNFRDYGQQFKTEIEHALSSGDFSKLNALVEDTVKTSVNGVADQARKVAGDAVNRAFSEQPLRQSRRPAVQPVKSARTNVVREAAKPVKLPTLFKKVGNASSILLIVFGGIGLGIFGLTLLVLTIVGLATSSSAVLMVDLFMLLLTIGSSIMLGSGCKLKSRVKRSERYFQLAQRTGYCNINELADSVGKDEKFVVKELRSLLDYGAYPQGHLDKDQKCFMITEAAFQEYEKLEAQRRQMGLEQADRERREKLRAEAEAKLSEEEKALRQTLSEGREYIEQIRQANDKIPGEVFSQKLTRMEQLLNEIFMNLEKKPEQTSKMHRLMNYYLPTTLKLVTAYEEFDKMSIQGENVTDAKREIENTIDTINDAFGELLNKLFADAAIDVTTDAQVLKTMLAREGLTKEGVMKEENEYVYGSR